MAFGAGSAALQGIYDASDLESFDEARPPWDQRPSRAGRAAGDMGTLADVIPSGSEPEAAEHIVGPIAQHLLDLYVAGSRALRAAGIAGVVLKPIATETTPPRYQILVLGRDLCVALPYEGPQTVARAVEIARAHAALHPASR